MRQKEAGQTEEKEVDQDHMDMIIILSQISVLSVLSFIVPQCPYWNILEHTRITLANALQMSPILCLPGDTQTQEPLLLCPGLAL